MDVLLFLILFMQMTSLFFSRVTFALFWLLNIVLKIMGTNVDIILKTNSFMNIVTDASLMAATKALPDTSKIEPFGGKFFKQWHDRIYDTLDVRVIFRYLPWGLPLLHLEKMYEYIDILHPWTYISIREPFGLTIKIQ